MLSYEYVAGLFDGEGSVSIGSQKTSNRNRTVVITAAIAQKDPEVLHLLRKQFKGYIGLNRTTGVSLWAVRSKTCVAFLLSVSPYLVCKRYDVAIALRILKDWQLRPHAFLHDASVYTDQWKAYREEQAARFKPGKYIGGP